MVYSIDPWQWSISRILNVSHKLTFRFLELHLLQLVRVPAVVHISGNTEELEAEHQQGNNISQTEIHFRLFFARWLAAAMSQIVESVVHFKPQKLGVARSSPPPSTRTICTRFSMQQKCGGTFKKRFSLRSVWHFFSSVVLLIGTTLEATAAQQLLNPGHLNVEQPWVKLKVWESFYSRSLSISRPRPFSHYLSLSLSFSRL